MRIRAFGLNVDAAAKLHELKDCTLVVDGHNFFYQCYEESGLHFKFGAECDRYAKYCKDYLSMFKNANVKCYFIFKGGTIDLEKKIMRVRNSFETRPLINPIFTTDIHLQVLQEMEFEYMFTEYECKVDCVALARRLSCPVLSMDIEVSLSGVQYIPKKTLGLDENKKLTCKLFTVDNLLRKYRLDINKFAIFILLRDEHIFPTQSIESFFAFKNLPNSWLERNVMLLRLLSDTAEEEILQDISKKTTFGMDTISEKLDQIKKKLSDDVNGGVAVDYLFYRREITDWFTCGVALHYVAKLYVDLYRSKVLFVQVDSCNDFMKLSLNIIKYAYDLLTNFKNDGLKCTRFHRLSYTSQSVMIKDSVKNPVCSADSTVFENGWNNIRSLGLFQHFIKQEIRFDCDKLERVPDNAKMLIVTLVYIFRKSNTTLTTKMLYGIILSYVVLGVVKESLDTGKIDENNSVTKSDCESVLHSLEDYFVVDKVRVENNILNPLEEFQYCLLQMNYLNKLCGSPYEQTIYGKTYNGTFVYNFINTIQEEDIMLSVNRILRSAPTVLHLFCNIIEIFKKLV